MPPITATDTDTDDEDELTYTSSRTDAASFDIVASSGQLQTKAPLLYATQSSYEVDGNCHHPSLASDTITVTISVTQRPRQSGGGGGGGRPTNQRPTFPSSETRTRSVAENTPSNQNIGSPVAATDSNSGDSLTYSLGGPDAASFRIETFTGHLKTEAPLDHETRASYSVTVSVHDGKNLAGRLTPLSTPLSLSLSPSR